MNAVWFIIFDINERAIIARSNERMAIDRVKQSPLVLPAWLAYQGQVCVFMPRDTHVAFQTVKRYQLRELIAFPTQRRSARP